MKYKPKPIDTGNIKLSKELIELTETFAKNAHDIWAKQRIADGWSYGPERDDNSKKHPCLIFYEDLPESEKQYDRNAALQTLKAIIALGYNISDSQSKIISPLSIEVSADKIEQLKGTTPLKLTELLSIWNARLSEARSSPPEFYQKLGERILKMGEPLLAYDILAEGLEEKNWPRDVRMQQLLALSLARCGSTLRANAILNQLYHDGHTDGETLGILARTYKDLWMLASAPDEKEKYLEKAHRIYQDAFNLALKSSNLDDAIYNGINASTTSLLLNQKDHAKALAKKVKDVCLKKIETDDDYWAFATLGETAIILDELSEAEEKYFKATEIGHGNIADLSSTRKQARILMKHLGLDKNKFDHCFDIPRVAVFAGHMIDQSGRPKPRFPNFLENQVRIKIAEKLKTLNIGIGYSSAACGSDILFLEAMLERQCEINMILPFEKDEFKKVSVDIIPNSDWDMRFESLLDKAFRAIIASENRMSGNLMAYEYSNQLQYGLAILRAKMLDTELIPLVVWDGQIGDGEKGTYSQVQHWRSQGLEPQIIDIVKLLNESNDFHIDSLSSKVSISSDTSKKENQTLYPQEIRAMLFFDVVRYSKLLEEQIPIFVENFMGAVAEVLNEFPEKPLFKNTWGDALYCVFSSVRDGGNFALQLRDRINNVDWKDKGLPEDLNLRISLHAGPVYRCEDPILKILNYTGSHVSRAARIEPITPPGQVFASQQFAALASAQNVTDFSCDYVGQISLPKKSGIVPLYVVYKRKP